MPCGREKVKMAREGFGDLIALIAVAQTGSFTRAAAKLGVTQPALSASIRGLEERLGGPPSAA